MKVSSCSAHMLLSSHAALAVLNKSCYMGAGVEGCLLSYLLVRQTKHVNPHLTMFSLSDVQLSVDNGFENVPFGTKFGKTPRLLETVL